MNKKKILLAVFLVALVAALLAVYFLTKPGTTAGMKEFTLQVTHADGTTKEFDYKSDKEFVGEALLEEGIVTGYEGPYGLYIESVDGEKAIYEENGAFWSFYIGDTESMQGVDMTPIEDGAVYKLIYTVFSE